MKLLCHVVQAPIIVVVAVIMVKRMLISHALRARARRLLRPFIARRRGISKRIFTSGKENKKRSFLPLKTSTNTPKNNVKINKLNVVESPTIETTHDVLTFT